MFLFFNLLYDWAMKLRLIKRLIAQRRRQRRVLPDIVRVRTTEGIVLDIDPNIPLEIILDLKTMFEDRIAARKRLQSDTLPSSC